MNTYRPYILSTYRPCTRGEGLKDWNDKNPLKNHSSIEASFCTSLIDSTGEAETNDIIYNATVQAKGLIIAKN